MARPAVTKTTELSSIIGIDSADEMLKSKNISKFFHFCFHKIANNEIKAFMKLQIINF